MTIKSKLLITGAVAALSYGVAASSAFAADIKDGGCCGDLEERVAELEATTARKGNRVVSLEISGQVNRALLIWDDGVDSDAYIVDPDSDGSRFRFTGKAQLKPGWSAGFIMEFNVVDTASNRVSQIDDEGVADSAAFNIRQNGLYIESETLGRVTLGQVAQPTDGINEIDVVATYSTVSKPHYAGGFFVRSHDGILDGNEATWGDITGAIGGGQEDIIRYDSPSIYGFILSAAWGDDDVWDVALRFAKEFNSIKLAAGIGYLKDNRDDTATQDFRTDSQLSGSISAIHVPSGIFATFAAGSREFRDDSPDATNWYVKGGVSKNWFGYGATTLFVDYAKFEDFGVNGGTNGQFDLDGVGGRNDTLLASEADVIGIGIVQGIDSAAMNVYATAQFFDADLEGSNGFDESVDHFALIIGSHIKF